MRLKSHGLSVARTDLSLRLSFPFAFQMLSKITSTTLVGFLVFTMIPLNLLAMEGWAEMRTRKAPKAIKKWSDGQPIDRHLLPCGDMSCYENLNLALDLNCIRALTPDLFLKDNALAKSNPEFYQLIIKIGNGVVIPDNTLRQQHVGKKITVAVNWIGPGPCLANGCTTALTLKGQKEATIEGTGKRTVYCNDPFLALDPSSPEYPEAPTATQSCGGVPNGPNFVGDWIEVKDCVLGDQDTAKIIYREWFAESLDGIRTVAFDTICVLRLPPITANNMMCAEKDTVYCDEANARVGPFIVLPPADGNMMSECDTIHLLNYDRSVAVIDAKCGLSVKLDSFPFPDNNCAKLTRYTLSIYQSCYGSDVMDAICNIPDGVSDVVITGGAGDAIFAECEFWLFELDTTPPSIECDLSAFAMRDTIDGIPTGLVGSGVDCGTAGMALPPLEVSEQCNEIKLVKAIIDDTLGVVKYQFDPVSDRYLPDAHTLELPFREEPYRIVFEAFDGCHNVGFDTCAIAVFDQTNPVVAVHRGINLEMNGKLTYLLAEQIDNNSYDNCEVLLILGRRLDWQEGPLDLCDSSRLDHQVFHHDMDSMHCAVLETDPAIDELEAFYAGEIALLKYMSNPCGALLAEAWHYDLCRYATVTCQGDYDEATFNEIYQDIYGDEDFDMISQIGGGWASAIPFDCEDACSEVVVELLVMDYWCNWSKSWSNVLVEDKTEAAIASAATDSFSLSCAAFTRDSAFTLDALTGPQPLSAIFDQAEMGDAAALEVINEQFGGYQKAWLNPGGQYVDADGAIIDAEITYVDTKVCTCTTTTLPITYYDAVLDDFVTMDSMIVTCFEKDSVLTLTNGIVEVNCSENTFCEESVSLDLDECGLGTITRTFKIWKTCGNEIPDTTEAEQVIEIVNYCDLSSTLFDLPRDTMVVSCRPEFDPAGSNQVVGAAHPDSVGRPIYLLNDCRSLGIAHEDKVLTITNGFGTCYLVTRTWYFADWCQQTEVGMWWQNQEIIADTFVQLIVLVDPDPPQCAITFPEAVNDTITGSICPVTLSVVVDLSDSCGLTGLSYRLDSLGDAGSVTKATGALSLDAKVVNESIEITGLLPGRYDMYVRATDACANESFCRDTVEILCDISTGQQMVAGLITNELNEVVDQVQLMITGPSDDSELFDVAPNGNYSLQYLRPDIAQLAPVKDGDDRNGISTADLIMIEQHILGDKNLESPWRLEAADVNDDGQVNASDILTLRQLILGTEKTLPTSDSWRFYESQTMQQSVGVHSGHDELQWIGVKIGDVNLDASARHQPARSNESMVLALPDIRLEAGRQYRVGIHAQTFEAIQGYQFTLEVNSDYLDIQRLILSEEGLPLTMNHFNVAHLKEGKVSTSWHGRSKESLQHGWYLPKGQSMFYLLVKAKSNGYLSDVVSITNGLTDAEGYQVDGKILDVRLVSLDALDLDQGFALHQNRPNPFHDKTIIGFSLPEAAPARITVYDARGSMLKIYEGDFTKGYNEIEVLHSDLNAKGVLYYQLDTDNFTASRKMMVIE